MSIQGNAPALKLPAAPSAMKNFVPDFTLETPPNSRRRGSETAGSYTEGSPVDVVGTDGKLTKVPAHTTAGTPTIYPTVLKIVDGTLSITLDATGITMIDTNGAGKSLTITFAALLAGKAVSLRVDDYCDGVDVKSQQHLATAPYV